MQLEPGGVEEPRIFWKFARCVDYSGPIATGVNEWITLMDHPSNSNHPSIFHVRRDGWMEVSFTQAGESLRLRYALYVHSGIPAPEPIEKRWREFTSAPLPDLKPKRKLPDVSTS